jgi:hypothetical protein
MSIENQKEKRPGKFLFSVIPVCIVLVCLFSQCSAGKMMGGGGKYKYDRFHNSDFPAYVETILFSSGSKLSSNTKMKWGNWTISFPENSLPVASSGGGGDIVISGLLASNQVQGDFTCTIQSCIACAYTGEQADKKQFIRRCRILIGSDAVADTDHTKRTFGTIIVIDCPVDVQLKQ